MTPAARKLNISQSAMTAAIKDIEHHLGTELFTRHARGMTLTHAGYEFLRHSHEVLDALSRAENAVAAGRGTVSGKLTLGISPLLIAYYLAPLLDRYRRTFPSVEVRIVENATEKLVHQLINGEVDAAILLLSTLTDSQALGSQILVQSAWRAWLPSGHSLLQHGTISAKQLLNEKMVALKNHAISSLIPEAISDHFRSRQDTIYTTSIEAVRSLVATGIGVALLPDFVYRPWSLEGDRIETCQLRETITPLSIGIAWRNGYTLSEATKSLLLTAVELQRR